MQVSDGGVHSHIDQLFGLIEAVKELDVPKTFVHFFSDGRDTRPTSGGNVGDNVLLISQIKDTTKTIIILMMTLMIMIFMIMVIILVIMILMTINDGDDTDDKERY